MKSLMCKLAILIAIAVPGMSHAWFEPQRGTQLRSDLMNTIRPQAEAELGAPVQFVVESLRVDGSVAFAALQPQRPGGVQILWEETQMAARGEDPMGYNGSVIHAIFAFGGASWDVIAWTIGAGEVWWSDPQICATHGTLTPEVC
ncbi:MAG: hypothetical protein AAGA06_06120 [Pseudomonadota bacterium]